MTTLAQILDGVLADPLGRARVADRAIGYAGADIPAELLIASGRYPCHLPWDRERPTPFADQWLERSFAPWTRLMLEDWVEGRFDFLEAVIFTRGDDSSQRLYYYICELKRRGRIGGPEALIFDIALIPRESSVTHTIGAVRRLAGTLGIADAALSQAIAAVNRRRALVGAIEASRSGPGALYERIARAALFANIDDALAAARLPGGEARGRILLAGTPPPDDRLHRAVEAAGWTVAGEAHDYSLRRLGPVIEGGEADPAVAIGRHAHAFAPGPRRFGDRGALIAAEARRVHADAAILWAIEEDEAAAWHAPAERRALDEAGIPALTLTRRRWDATDGAAAEIAAFIGGLAR